MTGSETLFQPSTKLVQYWLRSILSAAPQNPALKACNAIWAMFQLRKVKREFSDLLQSYLISEFRLRRNDDACSFDLFDDAGRLHGSVDEKLRDALVVNDDNIDVFMTLLAKELSNYFAQGGELKGNWGQVVIKDRKAVVELTERKIPVFEDSKSNNLHVC